MSKNNQKNSRLGRGLGSLLGASSEGTNILETQSNSQTKQNHLESKQAPAVLPVSESQTKVSLEASPIASSTNKEIKSTDLTTQDNSQIAKQALSHELEKKSVEKAAITQPAIAENPQVFQQNQSPAQKVEKSVNTSQKLSETKDTEITTNKNLNINSADKIPDQSRVWRISVDKIKPNKLQPRQVFEDQALRDLSESIKEQGILQPIVARRNSDNTGFEIISGERRWRASQMAGLHEVPVILKNVEDQKSLELALIENIQRADLNPIEEAEAFSKLMEDYDLTQLELAKKMGKERSSIANTLRLLALPQEVRNMISESKISMGHAKVILGIDDPIKQKELARKVANEKLSVRQTEQLANLKSFAGSKKLNNMDSDIGDKLANGLAQDLQRSLGTKVKIEYSKGKGKLVIHYFSDDQLTDLVNGLKNLKK